MTTFNFADLLDIVASAVPERTAMVCGHETVSYGELKDRVDRLAAALNTLGVRPGDRVGLQLINGLEYVEGFFSACALGAVPFNVNYRYGAGELAYLYDNAWMKALLFNTEGAGAVTEALAQAEVSDVILLEVGGSSLGLNYREIVAQDNALAEVNRSDEDLIIIYTGGTTGYPKGVMWPHKHLFFGALGGGGFFHATGAVKAPEELASRALEGMQLVTMPVAPLMHGAALWTTLVALFAGQKVVLLDVPFSGEAVFDAVQAEAVNIISIVGDAMALPMLDALNTNPDRWALGTLVHIGSGGAVFSDHLQARFREILPTAQVVSSLGATETGNMGQGELETKDGIVRYQARDDIAVVVEGRIAVVGEEGIIARTGYLPTGYFGDEEKTRQTLEPDGWLHSGDLGTMDDDGCVYIVDRKKDMILTGGYNVYPAEIERVLAEHPNVALAAVGKQPDEMKGEIAKAYVVLKEGMTLTEQNMIDFCRKSLAAYKCPRKIQFVDDVPKTSTGKIMRRELYTLDND